MVLDRGRIMMWVCCGGRGVFLRYVCVRFGANDVCNCMGMWCVGVMVVWLSLCVRRFVVVWEGIVGCLVPPEVGRE